MRVLIETDEPFTDEACLAATGKTISEWYAELDAWGALAKGRRETGQYLYEACKKNVWWSGTLTVEYERHHQKLEKDGRPKGYFICSTKTLNVPVARAFQAWVSPDALAPWFGQGSTMDFAEGGTWNDPDGNQAMFKRIRPDKDLRFTWIGETGDETLVDVVLTDKGNGKTGLLINHDRIQTRAEADGIRRAWSEALDRMKSHLEAGS